ncbi:hypothetical protein BD289DRAFT_486810 [Coniella lustricola]|uniref:Homeobox domain-containing protein n=1 Tax=Coniella lustricola TaxID=2025994 RepID=A0A2T2ZTV2_9PEZI|nr:hypothetical protein BD289DRAFT_486810 [Coniella lustricola]
MDDKVYQHPYHGLSNHDYGSRSLSMSETASGHSLDTTPAMHYRSTVSMAPNQSPTGAGKAGGVHGLDSMGGAVHYQNPVSMWHSMPTQQSNLTAMSMMPPQNQQHSNAAALSLMLQSQQGLRYFPTPLKMFPPTMQQPQGAAQYYHPSVICSKRFSEEEKQKLEKVFTDETQKPSTSRKRQLADELGCPIPKVNNWFQNRRAREKQMHRVQEYEAQQAADKAASADNSLERPVDDNEEDDGDVQANSSDNDSMSDRNQGFKSSGQCSETDMSSAHEEPTMDCSPDAHEASDMIIASHEVDECDDARGVMVNQHLRESSSHGSFHQTPHLAINTTPFQGHHQHQHHHDLLSSSPETFAETHDTNAFDSLQGHLMPGYSSLGHMSGMSVLNSEDNKHTEYFPTSSSSYMAQRTPTITTNMVADNDFDGQHARRTSDLSDYSGFGSLSPDDFPHATPTFAETDAVDNQMCTNASIASRRKTRPPQRLNQTALRDFTNGPKTGIDSTRRSDMIGIIRRVASATGSMSGKISKSGPPVSPLSPRSFDPSILEQLAQQASLNASTASFKQESASVSPVVPTLDQRFLSADHSGFQLRTSSLALNKFEDTMAYSTSSPDYSARDAASNDVRSHGFQSFQTPKFTLDTTRGNVTPDEALTTPGLSQFGSEVEFPMTLSAPRYVESEPATPSMVPVSLSGSAAAVSHAQGYPTLKLETPPQNDMYPWSRSPDQLSAWSGGMGHFGEPQSQTFQFQPNITPQNFNSPTGV